MLFFVVPVHLTQKYKCWSRGLSSDYLVPLYRTTDGVIGLTCLVTKRTVWTYCTSTGKPVIGIDMWNRHHVVRYAMPGEEYTYTHYPMAGP